MISISQAFAVACQATWIAHACAPIAIALGSETLVSETLVSQLDGVNYPARKPGRPR